jgi:hypothetical protein
MPRRPALAFKKKSQGATRNKNVKQILALDAESWAQQRLPNCKR